MRFGEYSFGSLEIDGNAYDYDVVVDRGNVTKRKKKASKGFRAAFGHTPLSAAEEIPWKCRRLIIGTGMHGAMPVMEEVKDEAKKRGVELVILPTARAIEKLKGGLAETNAILHLTC